MANKKNPSSVRSDSTFTYLFSESMETRNLLRTMLVKAQNNDTGKIPAFVSWPEWLDDGIVCLYASDLLQVLSSAIRQTATSIRSAAEDPEEALKKKIPDSPIPVQGETADSNIFAAKSSSVPSGSVLSASLPKKDIADLLNEGMFGVLDNAGVGDVADSDANQEYPSLRSSSKNAPPGKVSSAPGPSMNADQALADELFSRLKKDTNNDKK